VRELGVKVANRIDLVRLLSPLYMTDCIVEPERERTRFDGRRMNPAQSLRKVRNQSRHILAEGLVRGIKAVHPPGDHPRRLVRHTSA
jgi:hypothetical protein